ncbi:lipoprotein [Undibacterium sp.]|uniref:LPS translocon maturation chaperone LptM n=1 Tax=Undibacterium sp. TaxID=1914977 RepID=UPI003750F507
MNKHTRISTRTAGLIFCGTLFLSACGQKGPLYMPETKSPSQKPSVTQSAPTQNVGLQQK